MATETSNRLWTVKGKYEGKDIYLTHHVARTEDELLGEIMSAAWAEGFKDTVTHRLKTLGWKVVEIEFNEVV